MKEYRYMGYTFRITENIHVNTGRCLYEIDDLKPATMRPFLTTIADVRDFIADAVETGYWIDGTGHGHDLKKPK